MITVEFDFDMVYIDFSVLKDKYKCFIDDLYEIIEKYEIIENYEVEISFQQCADRKICTLNNDKDDINFCITIQKLIDTWNEYLYIPE